MDNRNYSYCASLIILYYIFSSGYLFTHGFYSLSGTLMILLSTILLLLFIIKSKLISSKKISIKQFINLLILGIFINLNLTVFLYGGLYQTNKLALNFSYFFLNILILLSFIIILFINYRTITYIKYFTVLLLVIWLILHVLMVQSSPNPHIDVFDYLKNGALGLLKGENPYSMIYQKLYSNVEPNFYSYMPFMIFYTLPFVAIFKDPRYAFIVAQLLTFYILIFKFKWKDYKRKIISLLVALLILFHPLSLYITEQSYTEPLVLFEITILYYFILYKEKFIGFGMGLILATKQYGFFLLPFLNKIKFFKKKYYIQAFIFLGIITLPFLIANIKNFIHDAILMQFIFPPRYEGLTFFSMIYNLWGKTYSFSIALSIWIIGGTFLYKFNDKRKNFILCFTAFLMIFFYFNKWAFANYYYLISNLILLAILNEFIIINRFK